MLLTSQRREDDDDDVDRDEFWNPKGENRVESSRMRTMKGMERRRRDGIRIKSIAR